MGEDGGFFENGVSEESGTPEIGTFETDYSLEGCSGKACAALSAQSAGASCEPRKFEVGLTLEDPSLEIRTGMELSIEKVGAALEEGPTKVGVSFESETAETRICDKSYTVEISAADLARTLAEKRAVKRGAWEGEPKNTIRKRRTEAKRATRIGFQLDHPRELEAGEVE